MKSLLFRRIILPAASVAFLAFALAGCGYTTHSVVTEKFSTIHIQPFSNKVDITKDTYGGNKYRIYRPLLESDINLAVTNAFLIDGNLKPATEELGDLVLKGELVEFRRDPLRYDNNDNVIEYRINIVVNLKLWDKKENKLLWEENNFTGDTTYFNTGSQARSEDQAVSDALGDLARRIVERTVENW